MVSCFGGVREQTEKRQTHTHTDSQPIALEKGFQIENKIFYILSK